MSVNVAKINLEKNINNSYRSLLGETAWSRLHRSEQERFSSLGATNGVYYRGIMSQVYLSFFGKLLAQLCRLIGTPLALYEGCDVPCDVHVYFDKAKGGMTWDRYYFYPNKPMGRVKSTKVIDPDAGLIELAACGFGMCLSLSACKGALIFESHTFFIALLGKRFKVPALLTPGKTKVVQRALDDESFLFTLDVDHPVLGKVFKQVGQFKVLS